jgi:hypothetical protein
MPSVQELLAVLIVIAVVWLILKMARVALRLVFFCVGLILILGALYLVFVR